MLVIVTENAPPRLRGRLTLHLAEVRAGVYVGNYGRRVRDRLWEEVKALIGGGSAVLIWAKPGDAGFAFDSVGLNRRTCVEMDGFPLVVLAGAGND
jgi:CRISPR-associated protein Cas2